MQQDHTQLIQQLYSALVQADGFSQFLSSLTTHFNLLSGVIVGQAGVDERSVVVWVHGLDGLNAGAFIDQHQNQDPLFARLQQAAVGELVVMGDSEAQLIAAQDPAFFLRLTQQLKVFYAIGVVLHRSSEGCHYLFFHRDYARGPFGRDELQQLAQLLPHIQYALQLYQLQMAQRGQQLLMQQLLAQVRLPLLLLDQQLRVQYHNPAAQQYLLASRQLRLFNARLHLTSPRAQRQFEAFSMQVLLDGQVASMALSDECHSVILLATPLFGADNRGDQQGVALFLYRPQPLQLHYQVLQQLYPFSTGEAKVCCALVNGWELDNIAEHYAYSRETVRTYLKRALKKTDSHRQSELVGKLLASPAVLPLITNWQPQL